MDYPSTAEPLEAVEGARPVEAGVEVGVEVGVDGEVDGEFGGRSREDVLPRTSASDKADGDQADDPPDDSEDRRRLTRLVRVLSRRTRGPGRCLASRNSLLLFPIRFCRRFFVRHNPAKLEKVDHLLSKYRGR